VSTRLGLLTIGATVILSTATARAQSAPTCSFDAGSATLTVTVDRQTAAVTLTGVGQIRLNNVDCTGATTTTTDLIMVNGGALDDVVTFTGAYVPGRTAEGVGTSEVEIVLNLGAGADNVRINFAGVSQTVTFTAAGIDVANDGDEDITTAGIEKVRPYLSTGDDTIDATAYIGGGGLYMWGGGGNDTIFGSAQVDWLYGQAGDDTLYGADGNDKLYGGVGNDAYYGEVGNDVFYQDATADGSDDFYGGDGNDLVSYSKRGNAVNVSIGNGLPDDGEAGELDFVDVDVEKATGGGGDDVLVGSSANNTLTGNGGADELYGGGGNDTLQAGEGADLLVGDAGNDKLFGGAGADSLDGGAGRDQFFGEGGNDTFINADGVAETVDCGVGAADDPELEGLDTFIDCELI
jgi:Ca2+-binding RTX toxin-like protein